MSERTVTIVNKLGLHARAAAKLVATAARFESDIKISKAHAEVNAKSILGVMMLAAAKGSEITLITEGRDEDAALAALAELIARRFDEDE